ncbi:MAG: (2Fe-2S)-binding protein [Rhodoplanes sp.]
MITLNVNGTAHDLDISPDMPLLWVLRDRLNLTSAKFGCGRALCGACTVHIDGEAARSCSIMAGDAIRTEITTIEAVSGKVADAVKNAWQSLDVVQCGYCQTGQIMSAITLLNVNKTPTDADIDAAMEGNICRCGAYLRIRQAIHMAAKAVA